MINLLKFKGINGMVQAIPIEHITGVWVEEKDKHLLGKTVDETIYMLFVSSMHKGNLVISESGDIKILEDIIKGFTNGVFDLTE